MQSRAEIQARSDEKRSLKKKTIKLHIETIELLESLANETKKPQSMVITEALALYAKHVKL